MKAVARINQNDDSAGGGSTILDRLLALHETARDDYKRHLRAAESGLRRTLADHALNGKARLADWHPLNGPAPTD